MREGAFIAVAVAAVLPAAAKARDAAVYHDRGPLQGSLRRNEPAPVYSTDPGDPWNRIFHLLYARKLRAQVGPPESSKGPWRSIIRLEGGDLPEFFFPPDAGYLVEEPRRSRLRSVLEAEISSPTLRGRTPEARILFQQDLWNRFDALHALAAKDSRAMRLARLLARLMARVALTKEELAGMRPSFAEAAQGQPDLLDPGLFEANSRWSELVSYFDRGPGSNPGGGTTMHARRAGWRLVFRRFVRVPPDDGGEACLREHLARTHGPAARSSGPAEGPCGWNGLPSGTTALLLETPLAISAEGGRYLQQEVRGNMNGQTFEGMGVEGYDNVTKERFGTWVDNMGTGAMIVRGKCGADAKKCTLKGKVSDAIAGKEVPVSQTLTMNGDNSFTFEMQGPGPDGKMFKTLEILYTRQ